LRRAHVGYDDLALLAQIAVGARQCPAHELDVPLAAQGDHAQRRTIAPQKNLHARAVETER
jgi:hypothetical protein